MPQIKVTGLLFLFLDTCTNILDSLLNITFLFEVPSKTVKDAVCLHKCLFHLIAMCLGLFLFRTEHDKLQDCM